MGKLKSIPTQVQLPGGIVLKGLQFNVVDKHPDGRPKTFELLDPGAKGEWVLFAHEETIRKPR